MCFFQDLLYYCILLLVMFFNSMCLHASLVVKLKPFVVNNYSTCTLLFVVHSYSVYITMIGIVGNSFNAEKLPEILSLCN